MDGEIGHEELETILENGADARVVDIRSPGAYERGHIPGSENVPLQQLVDDIEQFDGAERVVTVCPHGKSSVQAARLIASYEGFSGRAESFGPGLASWDGPIESGRGEGEADEDAGAPADEGPDAPF
ncbi:MULTISPECIES: rhodanese-like domain-containing protein [Halomicrobium]|uniref:Rhodanese domain protein n=2 Tax=Halomicrobium mukohataei TaxID=57705 RepID=C7NZ51_HALMD|nr:MULTISPECIES: rhodanese-like domain-containing protein [Halomicrobium]ACV46737.1 Rhodanese domain protein [Halomicrobium mukohataei DSM 12286]QCD65246.1 rhodanese-like domain-containing protein [Halomicrobium mukohataei]QFR20052.1 rhodanese-like domain-containing protein [Halomicrobium sp. ZPS1]